MASKTVDWSILRGTLIGFVVCVVLAAVMVSASYYFKQQMQAEYDHNHREFLHASQQYLAVDEEERIIDEYYPEFVRLYRAGLLGRERRLDWLETLRNAGSAIKIPELSYKIEAQKEIEPDYPLQRGGYGIFASPMNLNAGLLHEGDLLQLLQSLERDALGQFTVRKCDMRMATQQLTLEPGITNIRADCTIDWLTVDLAGDEELVL